MNRTPPKIEMSLPAKGFGQILWHGFDWYSEAIDQVMPQRLWDYFADIKEQAKRLDDRMKTPHELKFGGEDFQIMPTGAAGGKEFVVFNDDLRFQFSSINRTWSTQWRATAAGLAEYGLNALRERVCAILKNEGFIDNPNHFEGDDFIKCSRIDYAFDIQSKAFTKMMVPKLANTVVTPSKVKTRGDFWSRGQGHGHAALKTITIGKINGCQVQIYNKIDEITEMSGKTWMYELWKKGGAWDGELSDVWRVEVRMAGDWLKVRECGKNPEKILASIWTLISDALFNRRITLPNGDTNRRRWPLHPLFTMIIQEIENPAEFLPIGRQITGKKEAYEEMLTANIAGTLRSLAVLSAEKGEKIDIGLLIEKAEDALHKAINDPDHPKKVRKSREHYRGIKEAN